MLHRESKGAVSSHRVSGNASALRFGDGAIVRVDVLDEISKHVVLPVTRNGGVGVESAAVCVPSIWSHDDHLANLATLDHSIHQRLQSHALGSIRRPHFVVYQKSVQEVERGKPFCG